MSMMQECADFVIGIDTHRLSHTASVVSLNGAELATKDRARRCLRISPHSGLREGTRTRTSALGDRRNGKLWWRSHDLAARAG